MPHFHIDYSPNLEDAVDMAAFCGAIRAEAARIETFPVAGIRVRATRVDHVSMADGGAHHGFVDLSIRIREGRSADVKHDALSRIFEVMTAFFAPAMRTRSIALSAEMREISAEFAPKLSNTRDHMEGSA